MVPGICVPLCCLVDYKGFRLVAMSVAPITKRYNFDEISTIVVEIKGVPIICQIIDLVVPNSPETEVTMNKYFKSANAGSTYRWFEGSDGSACALIAFLV